MKRKFFALLVVLLVLAVALPAAAGAARPSFDDPDFVREVDFRMDPLTQAQAANKETAMDALLNGKAFGKTHEVARGQYVELARAGEDPVWTVLGEFGDFAHNNIAEPDRATDNTTYWVEDFSRDHYEDLLFSEGKDVISMRQWYIEQSSNRYAVYGDVTDWVTAPDDACSYDDDDYSRGYPGVWQFMQDTVDEWYAQQIAAGKTPEEINAYLSDYDIWDRYDWNGNGNFDESDGYIDHMNFVHASEGNEAGGGVLGDCAIWSHSWFAWYQGVGLWGPDPDWLIGGIQIGDSDYWINKYVINPENGGVGVFAHEFGHDLGLPDLYDYTGENSTGFWTMMSSGSWLSQNPEYIGTEPGHFGVWEKFQLGWLNYDVARAGQTSAHKLGPAETNTKQAQGLFVILPPKPVTEEIAEPYSGSYFYYSGAGNNLDNWMTKEVALPAGASLTAMVNFEIELDWDYAYVVVSNDGGANWTSVETNFSTTTNPNGQNFGNGITGNSAGWQTLTADLTAFAGQTVEIGFRYWTDVAAVEPGFMVDDVTISGQPLDDAEGDAGWIFEGFRLTTGTEFAFYNNYYVAEFRQYRGFDTALATAYNFVGGNWAERFPYQDGLLISYWDTSFANNNVGANCAGGRCGGLLLPIDAHPELMYCADGGLFRNRVQTFDATFSLEPTDEVTLHCRGEASTFSSQPGVRVFDDLNSYYDPANPMGSVIVPNTGTQIVIKNYSAQGNFMQVLVTPSK